MKEIITVYDDGVRLDIPFEACVLYHGRDSIGGLSLGYRLLFLALKELVGERPLERKEITFRTAFPGPGLRDAIEMTTRAVTRGAYEIIDNFPQNAPEGVYGRMYFEVSVSGKTLRCTLKEGVVSNEFIRTGRKIKEGNPTTEQLREWRRLKDELSEAVWSVKNFKDVFELSLEDQ